MIEMFCKRCGEAVTGESFAEMRCGICNGHRFTTEKPEILIDEPLIPGELTDHEILQLIQHRIKPD